MDQAKSKVTLYMRPELHKQLKLRSVHLEMKMSEVAEQILERYLLEFGTAEPFTCPHCQSEIQRGAKLETVATKLPVGSA